MKLLLQAIFLIFLISCSNEKSKLEIQGRDSGSFKINNHASIKSDTAKYAIDKGNLNEKLITITVNFAAIECTCPQWVETKNLKDTATELKYFYLEQGKAGIINADELYVGKNLPLQLKLTGQFYNKVGYPKNYHPTKGDPEPARVFRYVGIKVIRTK